MDKKWLSSVQKETNYLETEAEAQAGLYNLTISAFPTTFL